MYKILLAGSNNAIINDFFTQMYTAFECQNCSCRYDDILSHARYFKPDAFIFCLSGESKSNISNVSQCQFKLEQRKIPIILMGSQTDCDEYMCSTDGAFNYMITTPVTQSKIIQRITSFLNGYKNKHSDIMLTMGADDSSENYEPSIERDALNGIDEESGNESIDWDAIAAELNIPPINIEHKNGKKRILVVDDDAAILRLIKTYLGLTYDVATAISGAVALKYLSSKHVDLILLDYEMPEEKGPEVLEKIRSMDKLKDTPVIFLTGVSDTEKIKKVLVLKPQGYLLKPIDHDKLLESIKKVLE